MTSRAFSTVCSSRVLRVAVPTLVLLLAPVAAVDAAPAAAPVAAAVSTVAPTPAGTVAAGSDEGDDTTRPTVNEFFPEERPLSDCLSSLPKPNCGSDARGGWAQTTVFLLMIAGLAFIGWRIVAGARKGRRPPVSPGTPNATTAPDGDGGVPAP